MQSKAITIKPSPDLVSSAAIRGYNVTFIGEVLHKPFAFTMFLQLVYANSDLIQVHNILPAFNYTAIITPLYIQGVGSPVYLNFSSLEYCKYPMYMPSFSSRISQFLNDPNEPCRISLTNLFWFIRFLTSYALKAFGMCSNLEIIFV